MLPASTVWTTTPPTPSSSMMAGITSAPPVHSALPEIGLDLKCNKKSQERNYIIHSLTPVSKIIILRQQSPPPP